MSFRRSIPGLPNEELFAQSTTVVRPEPSKRTVEEEKWMYPVFQCMAFWSRCFSD
jgi:hypothetical protein